MLLIISTGIATGIDLELQPEDSGTIAQELKPGKTEYFNILLNPKKPVFASEDTLSMNIFVTDKNTNAPVTGATVTADLSIYQGEIKKKIELPADEGVYVVEQKIITKNIGRIPALETGDGNYVIKKRIDSEAKLGGITITITVTKDDKSDIVRNGVSFMGFNTGLYAVGVTLFAAIAGLLIGIVCGKIHR